MKSTFKNSIIAIAAALVLGAASISNAQVKIGANPTTIAPSSNLEVEAGNGNKTIVNKTTGQVTIQDGTQGTGKLLTSGAIGNSSWQSLTQLKIPTLVFIGSLDNTVTLPASTAGNVISRVPLNPTPGYGVGWDLVNKAYTVPISGYYRVEWIAQFSTTTDVSAGAGVIIMLRGKLLISANEPFIPASAGVRSLVETAYYNAGDLIFGHLWLSSSSDQANIYKSNLNITYLP